MVQEFPDEEPSASEESEEESSSETSEEETDLFTETDESEMSEADTDDEDEQQSVDREAIENIVRKTMAVLYKEEGRERAAKRIQPSKSDAYPPSGDVNYVKLNEKTLTPLTGYVLNKSLKKLKGNASGSEARIMIDIGSVTSFITEQSVKRLGLVAIPNHVSEVNARYTIMGVVQFPTQEKTVELPLQIEVEGNKVIEKTGIANVVQRLCGRNDFDILLGKNFELSVFRDAVTQKLYDRSDVVIKLGEDLVSDPSVSQPTELVMKNIVAMYEQLPDEVTLQNSETSKKTKLAKLSNGVQVRIANDLHPETESRLLEMLEAHHEMFIGNKLENLAIDPGQPIGQNLSDDEPDEGRASSSSSRESISSINFACGALTDKLSIEFRNWLGATDAQTDKLAVRSNLFTQIIETLSYDHRKRGRLKSDQILRNSPLQVSQAF